MMRSLALITTLAWVMFSFHIAVSHPLVECWYHAMPVHQSSEVAHTCDHETSHHGNTPHSHADADSSHTPHCHGFHPDMAKAQPNQILVAPPAFSVVNSPVSSPMGLRISGFMHLSVSYKVPWDPLFLTNRSLLI